MSGEGMYRVHSDISTVPISWPVIPAVCFFLRLLYHFGRKN